MDKSIMKKKKVLVIATTKLYLAGITTVLLNVANITKDRYKLSFVLAESGDQNIIQQLQKSGDVFFLPSRRHQLLRYLYQLKKNMEEGHYDIVHIHGNSATMAFDLLAAVWSGIPKRITHCHSCAPQPWFKQQTLKRILNKYVSTPVACSRASGEMLYSRPFTVVNNSIDCERFRSCQENRQR